MTYSNLKCHTFAQMTPERIEKIVKELMPVIGSFLFDAPEKPCLPS